MSYLPPGWTEQRLVAATSDDLKALPYETLHLIPPHKIKARDAQDVVFGAIVDEQIRSERVRFNLPPNPPRFKPGMEDTEEDPAKRETTAIRNRQFLDKARLQYFDELAQSNGNAPVPTHASAPASDAKLPRDAVVQVVEDQGYADFGFLMVRLVYNDEARWDRFNDSFLAPLERELSEAQGGERIVDNLLMMTVEDEMIDGTGFQGTVAYCEELHNNDMVQPGLDTSMVLAVDEQALKSFLEPTPGQKPWVWAVDMSYPFDERQQPPVGDPPTDAYPGYFRVTLSAAVLELWPLLKAPGGFHGRRLWDPNTRVWDGDL
ncbi:ww rsp5 wwp [Ophiostoma piceae UAMH 11346]|uniref:Ww rsp5 wwp n=1 Tax=Ophiostoma piceae (strain UAMH 11346) TaxID=1262450 RepID=S3C403_OPHP1|nr:ww rsp5 wwp [Ophiostoma piceae UAMH 11346]